MTTWKEDYLIAAELVAAMYEAVTHNTGEPVRGVLEDVQDRVAELEKYEAQFKSMMSSKVKNSMG